MSRMKERTAKESMLVINLTDRPAYCGLVKSLEPLFSQMSLLLYETETHQGRWPKRELKFVDNTMLTMMPSSRTTNWPHGIPKSLQSYAEFNPDGFWLPNIFDQIISHPRHDSKTFLFCYMDTAPVQHGQWPQKVSMRRLCHCSSA